MLRQPLCRSNPGRSLSGLCGQRNRHAHLFFERQQSQALKEMEWEGRVEPLTPWSTLILRGAGVVVVASAILAFRI